MELLTLTASPSSKGFVYGTEFVFAISDLNAFTSIIWDFGDGKYQYDVKQVAHTYNFPGLYRIVVNAKTNIGDEYEAFTYIDVDYAIRDQLYFTNIPTELCLPGSPTKTPYTVRVISSKINEPISIVFHAIDSRSVPYYSVKDKWKFLVPQWRFINADTNKLMESPHLLTTQPIYKNSKVIAVSADASFYFVDDSPTYVTPDGISPTLLSVTLSTENFSYPPESLIYPYYSYSNNSFVKAVCPQYISDLPVTGLKVTENLISDIYPIKWTNVPIPILITCTFDASKSEPFFSLLSSNSVVDVLNYPKTNELGILNDVKISLSGVDPSLYKLEDKPLQFLANDEINNSLKGYIFTTITPLSTFSTTCVTVSTIAENQVIGLDNKLNFPVGYPVQPNIYVAHAFAKNINKVFLVPHTTNKNSPFEYFKNNNMIVDGYVNTISLSSTTTYNTNNDSLSSIIGVYGIAFNPENSNLYATDADRGTIYKISSEGVLTHTAYISSVTGSNYNTPTHISIDSQSNVWVALFDQFTLLKYNSDLTTLLASAVPLATIPLTSIDISETPLISPPVVEVDQQNNVWACYSNPLSSFVVKFNSTGKEIARCKQLPLSSSPVSLAINKNNNLWVACEGTNEIRMFNSEGLQRYSIPILKPKYLTIDNDNNLWVLHGYNLYSYVNTKSLSGCTWKISTYPELQVQKVFNSIVPIQDYPSELVDQSNIYDEIWGGVATDAFNRIFAIDSENNKIIVFDKNAPENIRLIQLSPKITTNYTIKPTTNFITEEFSDHVRSAQGSGDLTGNSWLQKFGDNFYRTEVHGKSAPFAVKHLGINNEQKTMQVYVFGGLRATVKFTGDRIGTKFGYRFFGELSGDFEAVGYFTEGRVDLALTPLATELDDFEYKIFLTQSSNENQSINIEFIRRDIGDLLFFNTRRYKDLKITKVNDNFDYADYLKSLALPQTLVQSPKLFDELFAAIGGNGKQIEEDLGKTVYEKIANFVSNHSDIDTAEIASLHTMADQTGINYKTYGTDFPVEITNFLNLFSISKHHLRGVPVYDSDVFDNLGDYVNFNDHITIGETLVIKDKIYDKYLMVVVPEPNIGTSASYPLSSVSIVNLRKPLEENYHFFKYDPHKIVGYKSNVIDWSENLTSIPYSLSSNEEWYSDDGIIDVYFNNILTRGLFPDSW